jgi:hypothetical protein
MSRYQSRSASMEASCLMDTSGFRAASRYRHTGVSSSARRAAAAAVALLAVMIVSSTEAAVTKLSDGRFELAAPWTDEQHTTACPNPDPRICPVMAMDVPAMVIRSQDESVVLRDVARLTDAEKAQGATTPFFLYNYKYDPALGQKRYTEYNGPDTIEIRSTNVFVLVPI